MEYLQKNYVHYYAIGAVAGGLLAMATLLWMPKYASESLITVPHGMVGDTVAVMESSEYQKKALSEQQGLLTSLPARSVENVLKRIQVKVVRDDLLSVSASTREPETAAAVINNMAYFLVKNSESLGLWKSRGKYIYLAELKKKASACLVTHQASKKLLVDLTPLLLMQLRIMGGLQADMAITVPGTNQELGLKWAADSMLLAAQLPLFNNGRKSLPDEKLIEINQLLYCEQLLDRINERLDIDRQVAASEFRQLTHASAQPLTDNLWSLRLILGSMAAGLFCAWAFIAIVRVLKRELPSN